MKPTDEQIKIKKFWERCELGCLHEFGEVELYCGDPHDVKATSRKIRCKKCGNEYWDNWPVIGEYYLLPHITLNNLFKWAVPVAHNKLGDEKFYDLMCEWIKKVIFGDNPASALFLIINERIKE